MTKQEDWLNSTSEPAIEPDIPICDAHHHLWRPVDQLYLSKDFIRDASGGHNIIKTVFVQATKNRLPILGGMMTPIEETEFVVKDTKNIDTEINLAAAIIGYADLSEGHAVEAILESHIAAGDSRFRGVRFMPEWNPDSPERHSIEYVLSSLKFQDGFKTLREYNLVCDMMIGYYHMAELAKYAKLFPDIPIVINHLGFPVIKGNKTKREEIIQTWKSGIEALAPFQNIYMKLGGIGGGMLGLGWSQREVPPDSAEVAEAIAPYFIYCIEKFGMDRCVLESNFPVDKKSYSYTIIWNAFKLFTKQFSESERKALFCHTAEKIYHI